jgi:two-component system CheB/CheR fusion protein
VYGCEASVLADRDRIVQVLDNLLSNAIKYSPAGGRIDVSCAVDNGDARISVRDQGLGISGEDQARLFTPYSRCGRQARISGHGLGLFISSEIVRQHGGQIGVRSEPGKGAEFWFTLPLVETPVEPNIVH